MRTSYIAAGVLVVGLVLWMASGLIDTSDSDTIADDNNASSQITGNDSANSSTETNDDLMRVQVTLANLESRPREIVLQGQLEPTRVLQVRAETSSTIDAVPVIKGDRVNAGDEIVALAMNGRDQDLAEADAQVASAVSEQKAAAQLRQQGLQSVVQSQRANATLASAQAQRNRIRRDISKIKILAPFDGILNDLSVEVGALVSIGDVVAQLVDDSSYKVTAQVAQQAVGELSVGQNVTVELITGQTLEGTLSFVATVANAQTRSFTVEATVKKPEEPVSAGVSASLKIPVETLETVFLTPSALSLGDRGELGVKIVNEENVVEFVPIKLLSTTIDGAWVSGVSVGSRIITLGQAFVAEGEIVDPILANNESKDDTEDDSSITNNATPSNTNGS